MKAVLTMVIFDQIERLLALLAEAAVVGKAIAFFLVWLVLWLPVAIPLARLLKWQPPKPLAVEQKLPLLASLYLIAPLIVWGASLVEGVPFSDYGLNWKASVLVSLGQGLGLAVLSLVVVFGIEKALGWINWRWEDDQTAPEAEIQSPKIGSVVGSILLPTLLIGLLVSGIEELIFRGFLLTSLQQDYSVWVAAVISSLIFALLHLVWEQQETLPQLPGLWLMGMVLVLARVCDGGSLGLPWGLHAGWIWVIASLDTVGLITYTGKVPAWMTGLGEKPLAGGMGILCVLGTGGLLWVLFN